MYPCHDLSTLEDHGHLKLLGFSMWPSPGKTRFWAVRRRGTHRLGINPQIQL